MVHRIVTFAIFIFVLSGCSKYEGKGGCSTIKGKIFLRDLDSQGNLKEEYYVGRWPVYIVYGDDDFYGDKVETHYDGTFVFEYLYAGTYKIYTYSKCKPCPGNVEPIIVEVDLKNDEVKTLEDIIVLD